MDESTPNDSPCTAIEDLQPCKDEEHTEAEPERGAGSSDSKGHAAGSKVTQETYRSGVGGGSYIAIQLRPDIAWTTATLASFCAAPQDKHVTGLKKMMRYLSGTKGLGIKYGTIDKEEGAGLMMYVDSDHAGDKRDRKSVTGYVAKYNGGPVSWTAKKQSSVATSSTEAEYMAMAEAAREAVWFRRILSELGEEQEGPTVVRADNRSAICIAGGDGKEERRKHIDVKHHYIKEQVEKGVIHVVWIPSEKNQADIFTKGLDRIKFRPLRDALMSDTKVAAYMASACSAAAVGEKRRVMLCQRAPCSTDRLHGCTYNVTQTCTQPAYTHANSTHGQCCKDCFELHARSRDRMTNAISGAGVGRLLPPDRHRHINWDRGTPSERDVYTVVGGQEPESTMAYAYSGEACSMVGLKRITAEDSADTEQRLNGSDAPAGPAAPLNAGGAGDHGGQGRAERRMRIRNVRLCRQVPCIAPLSARHTNCGADGCRRLAHSRMNSPVGQCCVDCFEAAVERMQMRLRWQFEAAFAAASGLGSASGADVYSEASLPASMDASEFEE